MAIPASHFKSGAAICFAAGGLSGPDFLAIVIRALQARPAKQPETLP
jgi:hypothetical protein